MEAKRGHGANVPTCDWSQQSCGWVDVNARSRRVTSASSTDLPFLSNVPSSRLSHVCASAISLLVPKRPVICVSLKHTKQHHGETSKGKIDLRVLRCLNVCVCGRKLCLCGRPFA